MTKDWDNLIILDCARLDCFENLNHISGESRSIISKGSMSAEFILNNFEGRNYHDTIYITANSHYEKLGNDVFFHIERVYNDVTVDGRKKTNEKLIQLTLEMQERYPDKRIITHFMQPHAPYVSERAAELRESIRSKSDFDFTVDNTSETDTDSLLEFHSLMTARRFGFLSNEELQDVYERDLKDILDQIQVLLDGLEGKTVLTADHGEMLGERLPPLYVKDWGHGRDLFTDSVRTVPWFIVEHGERREIRSDSPIQSEDMREEDIREHLKLLGYK